MKKIMFNDKYGLTEAVLNGRKTVTRRNIRIPRSFDGIEVCGFHKYTNGEGDWYTALYDEDESDIDNSELPPRYNVGEIVAIAQSYGNLNKIPVQYFQHCLNAKGWSNKMFVKAELMPNQIQILDVYVEKLQGITDEDCIKEGIILLKEDKSINKRYYGSDKSSLNVLGYTPRQAFSVLIDRISGKGTWESNPYVFRYEFELLK